MSMALAVILGSVGLVTAVYYWTHRLGATGIGVVAGIGGAALLGFVLLPERLWLRLTADPAIAARKAAVQALSERLSACDDLRRRLFRELPGSDEMNEVVVAWLESADADIAAHAEDHLIDFRASVSIPAAVYRTNDGRDLSSVQADAIARLDAYRKRLAAIVKEVRRE